MFRVFGRCFRARIRRLDSVKGNQVFFFSEREGDVKEDAKCTIEPNATFSSQAVEERIIFVKVI